jgi:hypothetical protein
MEYQRPKPADQLPIVTDLAGAEDYVLGVRDGQFVRSDVDVVSGALPVASDAEALAGTANNRTMTPAKIAVVAPFVDVRRFGAIGNGVANDTTAIQAAIDAVSAAGGGVVQFPAGSFLISAALDMLNKSGVHLRGVSMGNTKIIQSTLTVPVVKVSGAWMGIHDMVLQYATAASSSGADVLQLDGYTRFSVFENLYLWNCHTGIKLAGITTPRSEFSNVWSNIRIGPFSAQGIQLIPTSTGGTGSAWSNIYINNYTGSAAGACTSYPLQIQNHQGVFNQLNIEWCDVVTANTDLMIFHQTPGIVINSFHLEGNVIPASRGFINTFTSGACSVQINGLYMLNNAATSGNVGIVRPGAGTHIKLSNVNVQQNTGITATWYVIFDTSAATGAVVILDELQDLSGHLDGFALNYAGSSHTRAYKGIDAGFFGATPVAKPTVTGSRAANAALASLLTQLAALGLVTDSSSA